MYRSQAGPDVATGTRSAICVAGCTVAVAVAVAVAAAVVVVVMVAAAVVVGPEQWKHVTNLINSGLARG